MVATADDVKQCSLVDADASFRQQNTQKLVKLFISNAAIKRENRMYLLSPWLKANRSAAQRQTARRALEF